ncbi:translocation/assembly module TamB domain-containing protein [Limimaricola sp. G21655-S1]|uniref:translocation/assembly module TamB domain-containing protein n=1 Tax=Limimaricola sp. G21655-S1 TaxID=3014768 RepID=UPI0022AE90CB|nr:translocation/assembly module TamB domain-containing protein [Limimaricola sp. G21655-S1]MCZ4259635.1 translocation/assembly module TamB domain-containing protein [Limimaricola sp. G21655-S1]
MKQLSRAAAITIATVAPTMLPAQEEQAERDRGFLTGLIEDNLSGAGREVIITGFQGALSSAASIEVMTIADEEGVWLRAENLVLDWNRSALLRGRLEVEELSAELIELTRPPVAGAEEAPAAEATPFSLPELPVSIRLDELSIDRLVLGEAFLDEEVALTVQGSAQLAGGEGEAQLTAERLGEKTGRFELSGSYSNDSRLLDLTLALEEAENGIAARALDLPGRPSVALRVEGAGPIDDFDAAISLATDGQPRISGDFALDRGEAPEGGTAPLAFSLDVDGDVTPLIAPDYAEFFGPDVGLAVTGSRGADGALALSRLSIEAQALTLDGSARIGADGWPESFDLNGSIGGEDGGPVVLPVAGGETRIGGADLALQFDASIGDQWVIDLTARDFARPGLTIPQFTVQGGGVIVRESDVAPSLFTADIDYTARGLQFDDEDLAEALGEQIAGEIVLERDGEGPVTIDRVTLDGPGIALDATGTVAGSENGFETSSTVELAADRLERFSGLTGLDLAGAADLDIDSTIRPLDGIFDVTLSGTTQDLALGIEPLDPYIGGAGEIALRAARDETGTRVENLAITTPGLTATAEADITSGASEARFDISVEDAGLALDGVEGPATLTGTASRDAAGVTRADVVAELPNGRAVIDATQAPEEEGGQVTLDMTADLRDIAPFSSIAGRDLSGAAVFSAEGTLAPDASTFDLVIDAETTDLVTGVAQADPLLWGQATLSGRALRSGPESFRVENLDMTSQSLRATGRAELDGGTATFDIDAAASDLGPVGEAVAMPLSGAIDISAAGSMQTDLSEADITLDASATDLVTGIAQADPLLRGRVEIAGHAVRSGEMAFTVEDLVLSAPWVRASGDAALDGTTATFDIEAEASDLSPLGEALDRPISGAARLYAAGTAETDGSAADLTLDAVTTDLVTGIAQADLLLRGRVALSGQATRTGPDSFSVEDLKLDGPAVAATGRAEVVEGLAEFDLDLDARDLSAVGEAVDRPLAGEAQLSAQGSAALDASTFDVTLDGRATNLSTGTAEADELFGGELTLSGHAVRTGPEDLLVENLRVASEGLNVTGSATIEDGAGDFDIDIDIDDLAPIGTLAGRPLSGAVDLRANGTASADLSRFDVTLDGTTSNVTTGIGQLDPLLAGETVLDAQVIRSGPQDFALPRFTLVNPQIRAMGEATVTDGLPTGDVDIELTEIAPFAPGLSGPATLSANASGDAAGGIDFDVTGRAQGTDIAATGRVAPEAQGRRITFSAATEIASLAPFSQLAGRPLGGSVDLDAAGSVMPDLSAFDVTIDGQAANLDIGVEAASRLLDGTGSIDARLSRDAPGEIAVQDLDIRFPAFSVQADATGSGSNQSASFEARLNDIGLFTPDFSGPVTASGTAARNAAGDLDLDVSATGPGGTSADVSGRYLSNGTLDLDVTGEAQLGLVNDLIEPRRLDGTARFDLSVEGPPALSSVTGTISTAGAELAVPTVGLTVQDIDTTIRLSGDRAELSLAAALEKGGRIGVSGPVALTGGFDADLVITLDDLELRDPELYQTTADGRLSVTGPLAGGALISGLVALGQTEIQVPSSGIGALGDLPEVRHVNAPQEVQRTLARAGLSIAGVDIGESAAEADGPSGPGYGLDVTISAPSRIFIRGRGLDAELGGELEISGTTNQVIPVGEFELIRGRLDILQQRFELDEGGAYLQGDFSPFIRLVATTQAATGTQVRIIIEGPASEPEVRFESTPDLPQDEVLAQLIFGRDITSLSPLQAVQLAAAVGTLAGTGGGGLIDDFRADTGLDDLDITTDDEGNAAVRAGKYLSENVYTDVTVGTDQTSINLNLDVTDDITAQGRVSSDGETSLGIFFERDY